MTKASILNCLSLGLLALREEQLLPHVSNPMELPQPLRNWNRLLTVTWVALKTRFSSPFRWPQSLPTLKSNLRTYHRAGASDSWPSEAMSDPRHLLLKLPGFQVICYIVIDNYCINYLHLNLSFPCAFRIHHTYHPAIATMQASIKTSLTL